MYRLLSIFWMTLLVQAGYAQNTLTGKITDQNDSILIGATIFMPELNKGTIADTKGNYSLHDLPNGRIRIQYSFLGYASIVKTLVLSGKAIKMNIRLEISPIETAEIVVTSGFNATQHENAVKIEMLKITPASLRSGPNFMEALSRVPGVDMISKGSGVSKPVIRGLSMNDILVLNHGVRFENYQYSSHHPLGIDEFGIHNVEIIKGPASLLYGSDAIGGVLNFIKERPAPVGSLVGDYNLQLFSNTLGITNNLGLKAASDKFFGGIRIGQKSNADFLQGGGVYAPNSRFNEYSLKTQAGYTGKGGTVKLYYDFNQQKLGLVEEEAIDQITERGRKTELFYQQLNTHLLSSQNKFYLGSTKLDLNAAFQNTELIHFSEIDRYAIQMQLSTLNYEGRLYLPSGEQSEYILGFQGLAQWNTNLHERETQLLPDASLTNYSLFGLIQHTLFSRLKLQYGLRYDLKSIETEAVGHPDSANFRQALDKNYDSFSGSLGTTYSLLHNLLVRANIAAAYRTPTLAELTSKGPHETIYEIGDEDLVPERSFELDLSMHYHKSNVTFDMAVFNNTIINYIFIAPSGDTSSTGLPNYRYLQNNALLYGGEAGLHFHPHSIPWIHIETSYAMVRGIQQDGENLPFIPADKINLELRVEKEQVLFFNKAFLTLNSRNALKQNRPAEDEKITPGYSLWDISTGGEIPIGNQFICLIISVNNVFDTQYSDHLSMLKEAGIYDPGRNFSLSLRIPFSISKKSEKN